MGPLFLLPKCSSTFFSTWLISTSRAFSSRWTPSALTPLTSSTSLLTSRASMGLTTITFFTWAFATMAKVSLFIPHTAFSIFCLSTSSS
ncbi:MAG: hypothetical protein ACK55Z_36040, partial [bacterium]